MYARSEVVTNPMWWAIVGPDFDKMAPQSNVIPPKTSTGYYDVHRHIGPTAQGIEDVAIDVATTLCPNLSLLVD